MKSVGLYISQILTQNIGYFLFLYIKKIRWSKSKMNYLNAEEFLILYIITVSNRQQLTMIFFMHFILLLKKDLPTGVSIWSNCTQPGYYMHELSNSVLFSFKSVDIDFFDICNWNHLLLPTFYKPLLINCRGSIP